MRADPGTLPAVAQSYTHTRLFCRQNAGSLIASVSFAVGRRADYFVEADHKHHCHQISCGDVFKDRSYFDLDTCQDDFEDRHRASEDYHDQEGCDDQETCDDQEVEQDDQKGGNDQKGD
jgi:hypothetical protein